MDISGEQLLNNVRNFIEVKGYGYKEFCDLLNFTPEGLNKALKTLSIKYVTLLKISDTLGLDVDTIVFSKQSTKDEYRQVVNESQPKYGLKNENEDVQKEIAILRVENKYLTEQVTQLKEVIEILKEKCK